MSASPRNAPEFDADEILDGIRDWVLTESPTVHIEGVNAMMDKAEQAMERLGAEIERVPGTDGYGDIVIGRVEGKQSGPGILVLGHLDTVHMVGTLDKELPFRREGDRIYGPGIYDMKGGMFSAYHALRQVLRAGETPELPVTFMFISDEEVGSPSNRERIEVLAGRHKYVPGARASEGRDRHVGDRPFCVFEVPADCPWQTEPCWFTVGARQKRDRRNGAPDHPH